MGAYAGHVACPNYYEKLTHNDFLIGWNYIDVNSGRGYRGMYMPIKCNLTTVDWVMMSFN